ncbi:hypothetical protein CQS02_12970 [Elizabethkingia miricola]|nr:hypothetical protein CQS02_12970 [Elizabethkingia miricola]
MTKINTNFKNFKNMKKLDLKQMENLQGNGRKACEGSSILVAGLTGFHPALGLGAAVYAFGCWLYFYKKRLVKSKNKQNG